MAGTSLVSQKFDSTGTAHARGDPSAAALAAISLSITSANADTNRLTTPGRSGTLRNEGVTT